MLGDDQERFEDYLELEHYIEELQKGHAAHLPQHLTPNQARIYRMAVLFCSSLPGADEAHEQFIKDLEAQLLDQLAEEQPEPTEKRVAINLRSEPQQQAPLLEPATNETLSAAEEPATSEASSAIEAPAASEVALPEVEPARPVTPPRKKQAQHVRFVSRRALLSGGAVAAASLTIGSGLGVALGSTLHKTDKSPTSASTTPISTEPASTPADGYGNDQPWLMVNGINGISTTWHFVTTLAQLGNQAVQFAAGGVIGYVILNAAGQNTKQSNDKVVAISAACTHMGCIVQWQDSDHSFRCPCHGGMFTKYGLPDENSPMRYLASLPRLRVKIDNDSGNIYVEVPKTE